MMITANDIVVSISVFPQGLSFLSIGLGKSGVIFDPDSYDPCRAWLGVWRIAILSSVFLVICLCVTRTISLLRPFQRQKIKFLVIACVAYLVITTILTSLSLQHNASNVKFSKEASRCIPYDFFRSKEEFLTFVYVNEGIFYTAPVIVVAISCVISVVVLTRRNKNVRQRELQQSRNRATVTILLFALLYGVCNVLLVVHKVLTICFASKFKYETVVETFKNFYHFDNYGAYVQYDYAATILLPAANSAANPILYFWRMPALREFNIMSGIRRMREYVMTGIRRTREYVMTGIRRMREYVMSGIRRMREYVMSGIRRMREYVMSGIRRMREYVMSGIRRMREYVMSGIRRMREYVMTGIRRTREYVMTGIRRMREYVMSGIRRMREYVMSGIRRMREYVMSGIRRMREYVMSGIRRMREYVMSGIRRMLGLNREVTRPAVNNVQQAETQPSDRVVENINIAEPLPAPRNLETRM
ncbi:hypothetical protein ACHWQZ_G017064 [Mnemiopsis leidyi]